jgi:glycosyltransferase involved in cell wall biosynthesis
MRFVMVARIDDQKDHATLFRALAKIKDRAWGLDLVGDGPRRSEMEALASELGITYRVKFHGAQRNVRDYLAGAQTFVLVTHYEGFPRSTVEAMRTGLPVIVTDVNGCKEALEEGVTGFSVPVHDVDALAATLAKVIDDPELRRRMGEAGRKRYENQFTFDQMFVKTKAVYAEVLGKSIDLKG